MDPVKIGTITYAGEELTIYRSAYRDNERIAIFVDDARGEPYAVVSENHPEANLGLDEFVVQARNVGGGFLRALLDCGLFEIAGRLPFGPFNTVEPIWRIRSPEE